MTVTTFHLFRRSNLYKSGFKGSNKHRPGTGYDLRQLVSNIRWTTDLNFSAGELDFDLNENGVKKKIIPYTGDIITFRWDKHKVFYGYVFKYSFKADKTISVVCYDKMRYLKNQDSIVWRTGTVADRFNDVCSRAGITHAVKNAPSHKVAAEICDGKSYFEMLQSAIQKTYQATNHMYFVASNYNTVELRRAPYKKLNIVVDTKTVATDFEYAVDIENTANVVRIVQKDSKKSKSSSATAKGKSSKGKKSKSKSSSTKETPENTSFSFADAKGRSVKQWGKLQIVENKKEKANHAQMMAQAKSLLKQKNMANKTLSLTCKGNVNLVAGNAVTVYIRDMGKKLKQCPILKAEHDFEPNDYKVTLSMKVGESWLDNGSMS